MFSCDSEMQLIGVLRHTAIATSTSSISASDVIGAGCCRIQIQLHPLYIHVAAVTAFRSDIYALLNVPISSFPN